MNEQDREIIESPIYQGEDEQVVYSLTTTPWGSNPSNPAVTVKDINYLDVTTTVTSGSASVLGDVITTPTVKSLTAGMRYRFEVKFTLSGNVLEAWAWLEGQE